MSQNSPKAQLTDRGIFFFGFAIGFTTNVAVMVIVSRVFFGH